MKYYFREMAPLFPIGRETVSSVQSDATVEYREIWKHATERRVAPLLRCRKRAMPQDEQMILRIALLEHALDV